MKQGLIGALTLALWLPPIAAGSAVYTVTMNTSPLVGNGPFTLDLQFVDGSGSPADLNNNAVTLMNFSFGIGGSPSGGGTATGGASGSFASGVTLKDTAFFNEYYENFTPGTLLSLTIDTTNAADPGGTPDLLTLAVLDSGGNELPTTGPASEFLDLSLAGGPTPQVATFGSATGSVYSLAAPNVQLQGSSPIPEPSSGFGLWIIFLGFGMRQVRNALRQVRLSRGALCDYRVE